MNKAEFAIKLQLEESAICVVETRTNKELEKGWIVGGRILRGKLQSESGSSEYKIFI